MKLFVSSIFIFLFWAGEAFGCWIVYANDKHSVYLYQKRLTVPNASLQETAREYKLLLDAHECAIGLSEPLTQFKNGAYYLVDSNGVPMTASSSSISEHIAKINVLKNAQILGYFAHFECNVEQLNETSFQISHYIHNSGVSNKMVVSSVVGNMDAAISRLSELKVFSQCKVKNRVRCDVRASETSYYVTQDISIWVKDPFSDEYDRTTVQQTVGSGFSSLTEALNAIKKLELAGACNQAPIVDDEDGREE